MFLKKYFQYSASKSSGILNPDFPGYQSTTNNFPTTTTTEFYKREKEI